MWEYAEWCVRLSVAHEWPLVKSVELEVLAGG